MTLYIYIVYYYLILYIKKGRFGESDFKDRFHIKLRVRMDKKQIVKQASQLKSKEDLLNLLNRIKRDEIEKMGFDAFKFHPFTMRHLNYYCNPNNVFHRYRQFHIKKKFGGSRVITAPRNRSFMMMLQAVNEILKAIYSPSDYAMGFTEGRSVVTNATIHKGQNYIFNIDLKDFFPSVEQSRVWKRLQLKPFNFSKQMANIIAGLCSMRQVKDVIDETKEHNNDKKFKYVLPQGSPVSPIITNMICDTLDRRLAGLARRFGLHYSRYADDITFSSMHYVYASNGKFRTELCRLITEQGFTINEDKTRLQKLGARQEVTGIIVSQKLNVTKEYVRDIRNILYIWDRYGYTAAIAQFLPKYTAAKGHVKKGNPDLQNVIDGKLMYLKMVKGDEDSVYIRLYSKFQSLIQRDTSLEKTNSYGISYVETTAVSKFEQINKTTINFVQDGDGKRHAEFTLDGKKQYATFMTIVKTDEIKDNLAISNCRNPKGGMFWLIHKVDKVTVLAKPIINIDELNNDLDTLLNLPHG